MRTAIVFHGLSGSMEKYGWGDKLDQKKLYDNFHKNIILPNKPEQKGASQLDVFMHSWSCDQEDLITSLYQPKRKFFEKQIIFKNKYKVQNEEFEGANPINNSNVHRGFRFHCMYSKWYSAQKAIELMNAYESENDFLYDMCMLVRFDLIYNKEFCFKDFDPNYIYLTSCPAVENDNGFSDLYTLSSGLNATKLFGPEEGLFNLISSDEGNFFENDFMHNHGQLRKIIEQKQIKVKKLYPARYGTGAENSIVCLAREFYGVDANQANSAYSKRTEELAGSKTSLEELLR